MECSYCKKKDVQFIPIDPHLQTLIESFGIRCPNYTKGCKVLLTGINSDVAKHINGECNFAAKEVK